MQLSTVFTLALPLRSTAFAAFELTCITQLGALMEIEPLPLTCTAGAEVVLSATRQYCELGEVGATMTVVCALTFMADVPSTLKKSIVTAALTLPEKLPSGFSVNVGVPGELSSLVSVALNMFRAAVAQLAELSLAPAITALSNAPCN